MKRILRDAWLVASFDLRESLRSRRAIALLLLYAAGAVAASMLFLRILHNAELRLADTLHVPRTDRPGAMTEGLLASDAAVDLLGSLLDDRSLARSLVRVPVIALFYGWLAFFVMPLFAVLASADAIAGEVASGASRYALVRTDRLGWTLGKAGGQAALLAFGIAIGAIASFIVGWAMLSGFAPIPAAYWLAAFSFRAWLFGLAYLGIALGISQLVRSPHVARVLALLSLVALAALRWLVNEPLHEHSPAVASLIASLLPGEHAIDFFRPDFLARLPAMVLLPAIGICCFAVGHLRFARRDG